MVSLTRESSTPFQFGLSEVPLQKVANFEKFFPDEWINDTGNGVTEEFKRYARPLIGKNFDDYAVLDRIHP